jgi:nitrogen regulatory protein PII
MQSIRRVEIIVPRHEVENMITLLENAQVEGYTVIDKVHGKGNRGIQDGLGLTDAFTNSMIIWYGSIEEFNALIEPLRKVLAEAGGICAVSEAQWVKH